VKVLVTGAAGFLGKYVAADLATAGHDPVALDLSSGSGDVRDISAVRQAAVQCQHVIHLAGMLGTAELFEAPHEAVDVNINGTLNVLLACEALGLGYTGITMPEVWDNVYQATKRAGRNLASAWHRHRGVPVSHVRAFNAYGAGQKLGPVQKIIPTFAARAWAGEPLPVWGDGTQLVDLVWAGDIARSLVRAMAFTDDQVFDAGTGEGTSVTDVANFVIRSTGSTSRISYLPMRPGEHEAKCVATGEGWELMGWHPVTRRAMLNEAIWSYR
jgi:UDP-glucose 4-epimerase